MADAHTNLLPCPFCGGEAEVVVQAAKGVSWCRCTRCFAETGGYEEWHMSSARLADIAAKEWNRRAQNTSPQLVEALEPFAAVVRRAEEANAHFGGVHVNDVPDSREYGALGITWGDLRRAREAISALTLSKESTHE